MGFILLILYLSLAYIRPFELLPWLAPLHIMQIVGAAAILMTIVYLPMTAFTYRAKQFYLTLLFLMIVTMSRTLTLHWIGGIVMTFEDVGITIAVFLITIINTTTPKRVRMVLVTLAVLSILLSIQSVMAIHYGFMGDLLVLTQRVEDASAEMIPRVRGTGFMTDPNDLAQSLVMAFPFLALLWQRHNPFRNLFIVILPMGLLLYAIFLTHSRGAAVSLVVMGMVAVRGVLGRMAAGAFSFMATFLGLLVNFTGGRAMASSADGGTRGRLEAWSTGLQLLKLHPFVGVGYKQFVDYNSALTAHNSIVLCFAELGFPTFCLWVGLLLVCLIELNSIRKMVPVTPQDVALKRYARAIQLAFYGFLTAGWFLSRTYVLTLYLLIALTAATADIARRQGKNLGTPTIPRLANLSFFTSIGLILFVYATIKLSVR